MICGKKSNLFFWLFFLVFFLSSYSSWADVTLTDQEYEKLLKMLDDSQTELERALILLNLSPEELESLRELPELVQRLLTQSKDHEEGLKQLSEDSKALKKYLEKQKTRGRLSVETGAYYNFELPGIYAGVSFQF